VPLFQRASLTFSSPLSRTQPPSRLTVYQYLGYRGYAMTEINGDKVPAEPSSGVEAPPTGAGEQDYVPLPWGSGSDPSIPSIDNGDDNVSLNTYGLLHLPQSLR
jgi:hypothetical protein